MGHGTELRVPFLDLSLVELAMRLPRAFKQRDGQDKWILREAFADVLPDYIRRRPKDMMSYSSGLHERARLFKPLFPGCTTRSATACWSRCGGTSTRCWGGAGMTNWPSPTARPGRTTPSRSGPGTWPGRPAGTRCWPCGNCGPAPGMTQPGHRPAGKRFAA